MNEDLFFAQYKPIENYFRTDAPIAGCMFETHGTELTFVEAQPNTKVWTLVEGDETPRIVAGFQIVNRIGYIITEKPWTTGDEIVELGEQRNTA